MTLENINNYAPEIILRKISKTEECVILNRWTLFFIFGLICGSKVLQWGEEHSFIISWIQGIRISSSSYRRVTAEDSMILWLYVA